jgi:hypothetical protein
MSSRQTETFLAWYRNLWETSGGDNEKAIAKAEKRLGIKLPELLRAVYLNTSMRDSQMMHLADLEEVSLEGGVLVFAREQQASWSWGIPIGRLAEDDPQLVANPFGRWEDDGCSLEEYLRFFALTNRPYEPPFIDQSSYEQKLLTGPWKEHTVKWKSLQHSLWTNGEAVLEEEIGNLGAKNLDALRRAAESLDIDEEEIEEAVADDDAEG